MTSDPRARELATNISAMEKLLGSQLSNLQRSWLREAAAILAEPQTASASQGQAVAWRWWDTVVECPRSEWRLGLPQERHLEREKEMRTAKTPWIIQYAVHASPPNAGTDASCDATPSDQARDVERLDWLQAHPRLSEMHIDGKVVNCYAYAIAGHSKWTLRELIDAAIAAERGKKE